MNKQLIVLAIAAATFAPAAMAQSANPVTLYGRAWAMINSVKATGGALPLGTRTNVVDESSLLGVRGTEDLGGGLKAFFQLESSFPIDANGGTFANRNSGVGLIGSFGTIMLGRWDGPFKLSAIFVDPASQNTIANQLSVINTGNFNRREINTIQYWSPVVGGFSARLMYRVNEERTATANPSNVSGYINYANGPIRVNYAHEKHKDQRGSAVTAGVTETGQNLAGTVVFGPVKLGLLTQKIASTGRTDKKAHQASVPYTTGKNVVFVTVGRNRDGAAPTALQPESKFSAIGYNYNFSRRSTLMLRYASLKNNAASNAQMGGTDLPTFAVGNDPRGFGAGLRHTF